MTRLPPLYAHRLGRDPGPDSSRAALAATLAGPVDGLETDVCVTADRRLALVHDPWLGGATTSHGWAHQIPWRELRDCRLRDRHGAVTDQTPMLLEELLERAPHHLPVQIEVKAYGDPELARTTAAAVCRMANARTDCRRLELLSFHTGACEEAARQGLPARLIIWADYAPRALLRWARNAGVGGVCIEHFLLSRALVQRLHAGGLAVSTGTINDATLAARAASLGIQAITTDRPAALRRELDQASLAA
jgi:glycerophosphoryl diester phosphodiesterase